MLIGVFSDAHGNEPGFYTCYEFLSKHTERIYYLGDAVGYFPLSNRIIDTLRTTNITCLKGNHDAMLLGELEYDINREDIYQIEKSRSAITEKNLNFLRGLTSEEKISIDNRNLLFVHGSPPDPLNGYIYPDADISFFKKMPYDAIFMGHTHRSFIKNSGHQNIVNVGSCGLPRDSGNEVTVALFDTIKNEASLKKFEMNVEAVLKKYDTQIDSSVIDVLNRHNKTFNNG